MEDCGDVQMQSGHQDHLSEEEVASAIEVLCADTRKMKLLLISIRRVLQKFPGIMMDEEDLLHDVIMKILDPDIYMWPRYWSKIPEAFIIKTAKSICFDIVRTKSKNGSIEREIKTGLYDDFYCQSVDNQIHARDMLEKVYDSLQKNGLQQCIFVMKFIFGYELREIASKTGTSMTEVKSAVRAIQRQQQKMLHEVQ